MNQAQSVLVCEMTPEGMREVREYLSILRDGKRLRTWEKDLDELLTDPGNAQPVYPEAHVQHRSFANRREAGEYLKRILEPLGVGQVAENHALWSWLGMFYFEQATARDREGNPKPSASDAAYILDPETQDASDLTGYRHRLMVAYETYVRHGERAWCMLDQPLHRLETFTLFILGSSMLFNADGIVELAHLLYADEKRRRYKTGFAGGGKKLAGRVPGSLQRLIEVLNQLYMTHDVYGMTAQQLLELLPPEFDRWRLTAPAEAG